jgi:hypothetical protein
MKLTVLADFVDGLLRKSNSFDLSSPNKLVIPNMLYFDDFKTVNSLGSKTGVHKLGAVDACLAHLPPRFNLQLKNFL